MYGNNRSKPYMNHGFSGQVQFGRPAPIPLQSYSIPNRQPYPYQAQVPGTDWYPSQQPNPYYHQPYPAYNSNYQPGPIPQQMPFTNGPFQGKDTQFIFQNPLQPKEDLPPSPYMNNMNSYPLMNPYPKPNGMIKQPGGIQSIMNSFKSQDGTIDINKMVNTAGQMMNAVSQVSSLVKGFGGMFKA